MATALPTEISHSREVTRFWTDHIEEAARLLSGLGLRLRQLKSMSDVSGIVDRQSALCSFFMVDLLARI